MVTRRAMIQVLGGTAAFLIGGTLMAAKKKRRRKNNNKNRKKREIQKTEQKPIEFKGVLSGDEKSGFKISGNELPLEIDGGMAFRIKKHVGKTVKVEGSHIKKGKAKPYVRVKHITPTD